MGEKLITGMVGIISAVIAVAIIAVILAPNSQTAKVLGAAGDALGGIIKAAVSPVTDGGSGLGNLGQTTGLSILDGILGRN